MSLIRYRPVIKNKEADMVADVSGAWTSLTCYYTLHDKIATLQDIASYNHAVAAQNTALHRLRDELFRLGDAMAKESNTPASEAWVAFKEKAMNRHSDTPVDNKPPVL